MGFISFSLEFYKTELQKLQASPVCDDTLYRAKQLLKMLDDLLDEGYTELNVKLEEACNGVSKLRAYLKDNGVEPFAIAHKPFSAKDLTYEQCDQELSKAIEEIVGLAKKVPLCVTMRFYRN